MDVLIPLVISAVVVNVLAFLTACIGWCAFTSTHISLDAPPLSVLGLQALYFVSTTMVTVGYGDIVPRKPLGQVISVLMHVQSLLLIVGMFSSLLSYGLKVKEVRESKLEEASSTDCSKDAVAVDANASTVLPPLPKERSAEEVPKQKGRARNKRKRRRRHR